MGVMNLQSLAAVIFCGGHRYRGEIRSGRVVSIQRDGVEIERGLWSARRHIVGVRGSTPIPHVVVADLEKELARLLDDVGEAERGLLEPAPGTEASGG
ncbi:MAG: hypothetical protein IT372_00140 [Polyangiaceae bacterium]|nr:hypothetical protein [Polyangiaceae bacterium]